MGVTLEMEAPMFARIKRSGKYQYLQIVENRKERGKVKQRVIATLGRIDQLHDKDRVETLIRSLSRFSERTLLILSGKSDVSMDAVKIGPLLIFELVNVPLNDCVLKLQYSATGIFQDYHDYS